MYDVMGPVGICVMGPVGRCMMSWGLLGDVVSWCLLGDVLCHGACWEMYGVMGSVGISMYDVMGPVGRYMVSWGLLGDVWCYGAFW